MGFLPSVSAIQKTLETNVARRISKPANPPYYVENQGQAIGPYRTKKHAIRRLITEQTIRSESGVTKDKTPELLQYKYRNSPPRFPSGKKVPRVSPKANTGNSASSEGWDYRTGRRVKKDTAAQRKMAPRGYYNGPGAKNGL